MSCVARGNAASHDLAGDHRAALAMLKIAWQIGVWFHRTFKDAQFKSGPFIPPRAPKDESDELRAELAALSKTLADHQVEHHERAQQLEALAEQLRTAKDEQAFWEQMAIEIEAEQAKIGALSAKLGLSLQEAAVIQPSAAVTKLITAGAQRATATRSSSMRPIRAASSMAI